MKLSSESKRLFTDEQMEVVRSISLMSLAQNEGFELEPSSGGSYHVDSL